MATTYVIVGDTPLARRACATLSGPDADVIHLREPGDSDLADALATRPTAVAVLVRKDVVALRYALAIAHLDASVALLVTVFDRTIGEQLRSLLPQATVTSPAALGAASLAGPCLDPDWLAIRTEAPGRVSIIRSGPDGPERESRPAADLRRHRPSTLLGRILPRLRPHEGGTLLMLAGFTGIVTILLTDWLWLLLGFHHSASESFNEAARVVATVGPPLLDPRSTAYQTFASLAMLLTIGFSTLFTAGIVDRLMGARLLSLFGSRRVPRSGHVIVVGLGQVGIRLCVELRRLGIPVIGVERNASAANLRIARTLKIPTVVGHGEDRALLDKLGLRRARALAAVGSYDLDNLEVAVAAHGVSPGTRVVLRAGEQEAIAETRSLLPLGVTRDVTRLAALYVVTRMRGAAVDGTVVDGGLLYVYRGGEFTVGDVGERDDCTHSAEPVRARAERDPSPFG